jgi:hypothetical protein
MDKLFFGNAVVLRNDLGKSLLNFSHGLGIFFSENFPVEFLFLCGGPLLKLLLLEGGALRLDLLLRV